MPAYASPSDLVSRHDIRVIAQLASDDGAPLSRADVITHPFVLVSLEDASGEVESALRRGEMYRVEDLEGLTGNSLAKLKRMVCTIAMALMFERRPGIYQEIAEAYMERSDKSLKEIQKGENTFGLETHASSNLPSVSGPTSLEYRNLNTIADRMSPRYLPSRAQRLPLDRG